MKTRTKFETDEIVRCDPRHCYSDYSAFQHPDEKIYGIVNRAKPDSDGDIRVYLLRPDDDSVSTTGLKKGYMKARGAEKISDREYHELYRCGPDDEITKHEAELSDEDALAVLDESQETLVQMQEIQARTVAPGLLVLPVTTVTSAANSQKWAISVEHPVTGEITFYLDKPLGGWSEEYPIVGLLDEYGIVDGNPYKLQLREVYVELIGDNPENSREWALRKPSEVSASDDLGLAPPATGGSSRPDSIHVRAAKAAASAIRLLLRASPTPSTVAGISTLVALFVLLDPLFLGVVGGIVDAVTILGALMVMMAISIAGDLYRRADE